jgi:hypothetical protein
MTFPARDGIEIEALVTDRYLDALLAGKDLPAPERPADALDGAVRLASRRLLDDLPRFHPSFRFEERLALRLAEAAAAMRLPLAAGSEGTAVPIPLDGADPTDPDGPRFDPSVVALDDEDGLPRPLLIGGAVAASALSLAGAAWIAWRRARPGARPGTSPMARAARAAHADRPGILGRDG